MVNGYYKPSIRSNITPANYLYLHNIKRKDGDG